METESDKKIVIPPEGGETIVIMEPPIIPAVEPEIIEPEKLTQPGESLLVLIGELKAKIEILEKLSEKVEAHESKLHEHESIHSSILERLGKHSAQIEQEKEEVAEAVSEIEEAIELVEGDTLPETPIVEEVPEEIQEEVKKRNRFFV